MSAPDRLPHRRRAWLLGVLVPLAVSAVAALLLAGWAPRLPDPVVTHWGAQGPDATGSLAGLITPLAVYAGLSLLVCGALTVLTGRTAMVRRLAAAIATGLAVLNAGLLLAFVHAQLDATTPADVADPGGRILLAAALAVVAGLTAAALAGGDAAAPSSAPVPPDAARADLAAGAGAVWSARATVSPAGRRVAWAGAVLAAALAVGLAVAANAWWLAVLVLAPVPSALLFLSWQVRVDATGLTVRAAAGRPRQHVPAAEVERADVVQVDPFGEFGGWGLRISPGIDGTVGVVLRKGEAIGVQRTGGRRFVVTVEDAATGAALLNTYAERSREGHPSGTD